MVAVALAAAAAWWLYPEDGSSRQPSSIREPAETPTTAEPRRQALAAARDQDAPADEEGKPVATPLPRDEVVLREKHETSDAGVANDDPASTEEKRDRMLEVVLDRLQEDLRAAQEAGDEARAAQLEVRIDRLVQRRSELTER